MNLKYEKKLWDKGHNLIAGLDEAGRGSWAGPLVAGAVILPNDFKLKEIRDSKLLSPRQRERLFLYIIKNCLAWSAGIVPHTLIDEVGILQANREVFLKALEKINLKPDYIIIDGVKFFEPEYPHEFMIDADNKIASVAAASIIAKVVRDKILERLHLSYPEYNFHQHKGYGTPEHLLALQNHGLSEIHRLSFRPMAEIEGESF
jgi:ribonuclease HII